MPLDPRGLDAAPRMAGPAARDRGEKAAPLLGACPVGLGPTVLEGPLPALARRIATGGPIRIVTIGSSSTEGAGSSETRFSYPSQLAVELLHRLPGRSIEVINTGVGGEEIGNMLARFDRDVLAHRPDVVIWQFGSNAALRRQSIDGIETMARAGVARIRASGADLILMDLQRVPMIERSPLKDQMLELIRSVARSTGTAVFRRYDLMNAWRDALGDAYPRMFAADRLHMNDFSYLCMAADLAAAIQVTATTDPPSPPRGIASAVSP
ncbi:MAG: SGNH/GDSL hydrolase family protein [Lautropia sp.]